MKHLFTISLVFFSLTHLAKAERVEGLRLMTERYYNRQQEGASINIEQASQQNDDQHFLFLSYNELSLSGILADAPALKSIPHNQIIADLTIRKKPKNNSP